MTESPSDQQLLLAYTEEKSDGAFRAIVDRHAGWIFAAAFRQLSDRQLAEDAVQIVFVLLAQRSRKMLSHQKLSGWLFNTLGYTVKNLRRSRLRRQMHEQRAALERDIIIEPPMETNDLVAHLDAAVAGLGQADRNAIVLRFYQDRSFTQIAETLGISEIAARKRVSRGTEKLRRRFEKLGVAKKSDSADLSIVAVQGLEHAPSNLAQSAAHVALAAKAGAAIPPAILTATKGTAYLMAAAKIKISAAIVILLLLAIPTAIITIRYSSSLLAQSAPPDSASASTAASTRPTNLASYYALQPNQVFKRITDAPPDLRDQFLRDHGSARARPVGHFFAASARGTMWLTGSSPAPAYALSQLINTVSFIRGSSFVEAELDGNLAGAQLTGDIIYKADAPNDEFVAGLAKFLHDEFAIDATVTYRDVPRKVIVLRGHYKFTPLPQAPHRSICLSVALKSSIIIRSISTRRATVQARQASLISPATWAIT